MTPVERPLDAVLTLDLADEVTRATRDEAYRERGRTARTLFKEGPLTVTLLVLREGASIPEHDADGPVTVQVLEGMVRFEFGEGSRSLTAGRLLTIPAGVRHAVTTEEGGTFLLTVASGRD